LPPAPPLPLRSPQSADIGIHRSSLRIPNRRILLTPRIVRSRRLLCSATHDGVFPTTINRKRFWMDPHRPRPRDRTTSSLPCQTASERTKPIHGRASSSRSTSLSSPNLAARSTSASPRWMRSSRECRLLRGNRPRSSSIRIHRQRLLFGICTTSRPPQSLNSSITLRRHRPDPIRGSSSTNRIRILNPRCPFRSTIPYQPAPGWCQNRVRCYHP